MLNIQEHRLILTRILKDIYSDFELSSILGLKGGTALYYFLRNDGMGTLIRRILSRG
jgi:hypothetical protein